MSVKVPPLIWKLLAPSNRGISGAVSVVEDATISNCTCSIVTESWSLDVGYGAGRAAWRAKEIKLLCSDGGRQDDVPKFSAWEPDKRLKPGRAVILKWRNIRPRASVDIAIGFTVGDR